MTMVSLNTSDSTLWGRNPAARQQLVTELVEKLGVIVTRKDVLSFCEATGRTGNDVTWLFNNKLFRASRGQYTLQPVLAASDAVAANSNAA